MGDCLYLVMPTYNEEANIHVVVEAWYLMLAYDGEDFRPVISDGGSRNKALEILYSLQWQYEKLIVIPKPGADHGTKVILLYRYTIVHGADWTFQTDSDGQTVPAEFVAFWKLREKHDIIMGDRKKRGDGTGRKVVENVLRVYLKIFSGAFVPDVNAPFCLMKSSVVAKYLDLALTDLNLPNVTLTVCFLKYHERVRYRIMIFQLRQGGKNYMNVKHIFKIGLQSIRNFVEIRKCVDAFDRRNRRNMQ